MFTTLFTTEFSGFLFLWIPLPQLTIITITQNECRKYTGRCWFNIWDYKSQLVILNSKINLIALLLASETIFSKTILELLTNSFPKHKGQNDYSKDFDL